MFFYISFLRPPPLQAPLLGSVFITPQIANDLRTEPFDGAQDIFYSWSQILPSSKSSHAAAKITSKPSKLTTYRQSSAYKEIPVPLPPDVREGQSRSLLLSAQSQGQPHSINLKDDDLGKIPLPVMSMPIHFESRKSKAASGKQEQIERMYNFPINDDLEVAYLKLTEQTSFDLDKKIWDSGLGLTSWLLDIRHGNDAGIARSAPLVVLKDVLFSRQPRRILELGAGTGIVALMLGALRSAIVPQCLEGDYIITTDLPSAMPLLEHNITANEQLFSSTRPQAAVLDWDDEVPDYIQASEQGFNAIVMADVTYNTSSFPSLIRTLSCLIRMGSKPPLVLLGYKERDPAERTLWDMAKGIGLTFEKVGERRGAGGAPVELWISYANGFLNDKCRSPDVE